MTRTGSEENADEITDQRAARGTSSRSGLDRLGAYRLYSIKEVAPVVRKTPKYLYRCIQSARDERLRKKYRIGRHTLRRLPVQHWFKVGCGWFIDEGDLVNQLSDFRAG